METWLYTQFKYLVYDYGISMSDSHIKYLMNEVNERRIQYHILICFITLSVATTENIVSKSRFPKGHQEKLGSHQLPDGNVEEIWHMPTASAFYYNYVSKSKPVIFKGAAKQSDAFHLWTDNYLSENFGDIEVNVDYGKKENRERPADTMPLKEFLQIYNKTDQYLVNSMPDELKHQFQLPQCILCGGFTNRLADSFLWFSSGGTKSFLHIDNVENINCLISGQKEWFFVDKENSMKIKIDHGEGEYCGVDVDKVDMIKYPTLQTIPWWSAHLAAGDCIYVPFGWAHQVRSYSRNIAVNIWWTVMRKFNDSDCTEQEDFQERSLNHFQYTHGEQIRFLILSLLETYNGKLTYDNMHKMIRHEHDGRHLVNKEDFGLLDKNGDNILVIEEIVAHDAETIEIALHKTPPGEINIRGMMQRRDAKLIEVLERVGKQEPYIEEFLLRIHKSTDDIRRFLAKYGGELHFEINEYLQEILDKQTRPTDKIHEEL